MMRAEAETLLNQAGVINDLRVVVATAQDVSADLLRQMGDYLRDREECIIALLASVTGDKATLLACCGKKAIEYGFKAGDIIKLATKVTGGSGGGKPESAMGGAKDITKLEDAYSAVVDMAKEKMGVTE